MVAPNLCDGSVSVPELTPVCCNCRRERISPREWRERVPVAGERLTHGICPACLYDLYPDIAPLVCARD
jgi:hypothetical protein